MASRPRKRHAQQKLALRTLDKNRQRRGSRKGDPRRENVGRPKAGPRASERHEKRAQIRASEPVHVVMRVDPAVRSLRTDAVLRAIRGASIVVLRHEESFRIVQLSVQRTHVHLMVEASDKDTLATGMKAFGISAAKRINALLRDDDGRRRRGRVFGDRYHARALRTPREVRNCLAYVLNNWRHHDEHRHGRARAWMIDRYSSALGFDGWAECAAGMTWTAPAGYEPPVVHAPSTWLLRVGWRRHGLIRVHERPGAYDLAE